MTGWSVAFGGLRSGSRPRIAALAPCAPGYAATAGLGRHPSRGPYHGVGRTLVPLVDPRFRRALTAREAHSGMSSRRASRRGTTRSSITQGHGLGDAGATALLSASPAATSETTGARWPIWRTACARPASGPPGLAYVNCCQGDAGGWLGAGRQPPGRAGRGEQSHGGIHRCGPQAGPLVLAGYAARRQTAARGDRPDVFRCRGHGIEPSSTPAG